jgi:glycerate kinase
MRVLIAPDKFKGSLTAAQVADHLAKGLAEAGAHSRTLPLADGGDGSVAAALASGFHPLPVTVRGATGQSHSTVIALDDDTAIVEVANTCGLSTLPGGVRAPMSASSYGFGQAIRAALAFSPRRLVLALGGSASTDGGIGMLAALGHRFLDRAGQLLAPTPENLDRIHCVDSRRTVNLDGIDLIVAGDVTSPLLGLTGAAAVFGPQKGATAAQVAQLDAGLDNLVAAFTRSGHTDADTLARAHGSGAAGGIGFAAMLLGATTASGADYFLDLLNFDRHVGDADLVITGEGRIDRQTTPPPPDSPTSSPSPTSPTATPPATRNAPQNYCATSEPTSGPATPHRAESAPIAHTPIEAANARRVPVVPANLQAVCCRLDHQPSLPAAAVGPTVI